MAAPFFNNISGTVTAAPTTGPFTLTGASAGADGWSSVPANSIVAYRADEGADWESGIGLWNGTTLSRNMDDSSSGALISFGTGVVVVASMPAEEIQPHIGGGKWGMATANPGATTVHNFGLITSNVGTAAAATISATNYLTRQHRLKLTSATTANAIAGWSATAASVYRSTTAFMGGFEFVARFGVSALPTGPRLQVGVANAAGGAEPSTHPNQACFVKDSTDTNIQFLTNDGTGSGTKVDTGIPLVVNGFYEAAIWQNPGEAKISYSLVRLDTGAVKVGSVTSDLPVADTGMGPFVYGSLSATTGTAIVIEISSLYLRSSF